MDIETNKKLSKLTDGTGVDTEPCFAPDGRSIVFLRQLPDGRAAVLLISALGGPERKLAEAPNASWAPAWSPDGKWLVIVGKDSAAEPNALFLLSVDVFRTYISSLWFFHYQYTTTKCFSVRWH